MRTAIELQERSPLLLIISAVRDEAAHLEVVLQAMAAQTRPPDAWLVIDDRSTDGTLQMLQGFAPQIPGMTVLSAPRWPGVGDGRDQLATAPEIRAFNWALEKVPFEGFDYIGKLDGDIELPRDYYEQLLERFADDPSLGIACGDLIEPGRRGWSRLAIPSHHVHGALKLYRRSCLEAIGGLPESLGWDTTDETYARMLGIRTRSFRDIVARHHRPAASRDGQLRGRARHGACAYINHFSATWVALRSLKVAKMPPVLLSGAAFFYGYGNAAARGTPQVDDAEFRTFVRRELRQRMLGAVGLARRRASSSSPQIGARAAAGVPSGNDHDSDASD